MGVRMLVLTIGRTCDGFASHFLWEDNPFSLPKVATRTESKPKESSVGGIGLVYHMWCMLQELLPVPKRTLAPFE
jgi:hypothetical protein